MTPSPAMVAIELIKAYWHVKNYARFSAGRAGPFAVHPTALGDGDVDYRLALRTVLAAGYRGPVVVEHYGGDAVGMQEQGRTYLERLLTDSAGGARP